MRELPKITSAMLIVTHACNLACRYCFVQQEPSRMSLDTAKAAAQFLIENAEAQGDTPEINFFGGEPLLMWEQVILPLTEWIRTDYGKPFNLSMTSNGILLTDERLELMQKHNIGLLFSLDGAKATQDYNRPFHDGRGSFDTLAPKIPKILKAYPGATLRMTAIPATCGHIMENILWGEAQGYANFFVMPNMFEPWDEAARDLLLEQMQAYGDYYINCYREGRSPLTFTTFEDALRSIRAANTAEAEGKYRCAENCSSAGKCGLGATRFASIHPNGNLYGCQEMTSNEGEKSIFYIGNLSEGVSEERRRALMAAYRTARGEDCASCPYDRVCDGGCVANNYLATGELDRPPELFCFWRRLLFEVAVGVMQTLGAERNEKFREHWERG